MSKKEPEKEKINEENPNNVQKNENNDSISPTDVPRLPKLKAKYSKLIRKTIKNLEQMMPKDIGSIYDSKKVHQSRKSKKSSLTPIIYNINKNKIKEMDTYNIFSREDKSLNELLMKFREKTKKDKISKTKRREMAFSKLYDITQTSVDRLKKIRDQKQSYTLDKYQEKMLKSIDVNTIVQSEIMNLMFNLRQIKNESYDVRALPPINIDMIREHVLKNKRKELRKKAFREFFETSNRPLDEYEKEEKEIQNIKGHKMRLKLKRNKNFDKLPEYLRDIFINKLNYH